MYWLLLRIMSEKRCKNFIAGIFLSLTMFFLGGVSQIESKGTLTLHIKNTRSSEFAYITQQKKPCLYL